MKNRLLYFELKSGFSDNGPAWIGMGKFSKSGQSIYFNNKVFLKANVPLGNYIDYQSGDEYWISGIKKNGKNRHVFGSGKINIDRKCVIEYLQIVNETTLDKSKFEVIDIIENKDTKDFTELFNEKL